MPNITPQHTVGQVQVVAVRTVGIHVALPAQVGLGDEIQLGRFPDGKNRLFVDTWRDRSVT